MLVKFGINLLKADKEIRVESGRIYKSGELSEVADRGGWPEGGGVILVI